MGREIYQRLKGQAPISLLPSSRVTGIPGDTPRQAYSEAKRTLVVSVRKTLKFESCKPSAHYQGLTFEVVTHRYTGRAKNLILSRFPESRLPMDEARGFFARRLSELFPAAQMDYIV